MKNTFLFLITILPYFIYSQEKNCDGIRYIDSTFSDVTITKNIQYGNNKTISGIEKNLYMDIYEPKEDLKDERALIILAFGGAFIEGERSDMEEMAIAFAKKGYVVSSIDYRLYDGDSLSFIIDTTKLLTAVVQGMSDFKAAIRFFKENYTEHSNSYAIDTNLIFAGGISSGGILANHIGLVDSSDNISTYFQNLIDANGGWKGNSSSNTNYSSKISGILNFSGAIKEAKWIDENDIPVFSVHDTQDPIVPYASGKAKIEFPINGIPFEVPLIHLQGSKEIHDALSKMNVKSELISIDSDEHVSYFVGSTIDEFSDSIEISSSKFMENIICGSSNGREKISFDFKIYPNPTSEIIRINSKTPIHKIEIIDLSGRIVKSNLTSNEISLINLRKGQYFVKATSYSASTTRKIILK